MSFTAIFSTSLYAVALFKLNFHFVIIHTQKLERAKIKVKLIAVLSFMSHTFTIIYQ